MSSTTFYPKSVSAHAYTSCPPEEGYSMFALEMRYKDDGLPFLLGRVHLTPTIRDAIEKGVVNGLVVHYLPRGGYWSKLLPGQPERLVDAVSLIDGTVLVEHPEVLRSGRRRVLVQGAVIGAVAAVLLTFGYGTAATWLGAIALSAALQKAQTFRSMPRGETSIFDLKPVSTN